MVEIDLLQGTETSTNSIFREKKRCYIHERGRGSILKGEREKLFREISQKNRIVTRI